MNISIVTPHYNDLQGLIRIHECLKEQTSDNWEWVIVDDASDEHICKKLRDWHLSINNNKVLVEFNPSKTNASNCRNIGAKKSTYDHLVFLDADDTISTDFVTNRLLDFRDFAVFQNYMIVDKGGRIESSKVVEGFYLNYFLSARFIWQTSSVLWDKSFFNEIGGFSERLPRLQDVELVIRAFQNSSNYIVLDNKADFYYHVQPIRERKDFLRPVCEAVHLFISELLNIKNLNSRRLQLLKGYYYLCVKYLERSGSTKDVNLVQRNLHLFYKKGYIGKLDRILGLFTLKLFVWNLISSNLFLRVNRRLFKPNEIRVKIKNG